MKRILSLVLMTLLAVALLLPVTAFADDDNLCIKVGSVTADEDGKAAVPIEISANPGIAYIKLELVYPDATFTTEAEPEKKVTVSNGTVFEAFTSSAYYVWDDPNGANVTATGVLGTINVNVVSGAMQPGASYNVTVNVIECWNEDEEAVTVSVTPGKVTVPGAPTICEHDFSLTTKSADTLKTAGDCQTAAVYYKSCSKCGEVSTSEADTFTGDKDENRHTGTPGDWLTDAENTKHWKEYSCCNAKVSEAAHRSTGDNAATCRHAAICDDCSKSYGTVVDHSYTAEIVKEEALKSAATCTKAAMYYKSCTGCGAVSSSETDVFTHGAALDHDWTAWSETKAASCTEKGEETRTCKRNCGVTAQTRDIDPTGHGNWNDDYKVVTSATCGKDGVAEGTCGRCQQKITNIVLPATGEHSWDEGTVTKDPTTTAEGEKTYTCSACGKTKTEAIAKLAAATGTTGGKVETKTKSPKTGDESHVAVWAAVLLAACGAAVVAVARRKKENERT